VGKPEGKRSLGTPRRKWEDNIKIDLKEMGLRSWTGLTCLRIGTEGGVVMNRVTYFGIL